jgi:hypothetical protein
LVIERDSTATWNKYQKGHTRRLSDQDAGVLRSAQG